jgi:hypothetical protein
MCLKNSNMLDWIRRKIMEYTKKLILHVQHIILLHTNKLNNFSVWLVSVTSMISIAPIYNSYPWHHAALGSSLALPYVYSLCGLQYDIQNNVLYFLFGRSHPNLTYHFRNPSRYHPSRYGTASYYISLSWSFTWSHLVHSTSHHTPATATGQAKAQIWAPMSSTW